MFEHVSKKEWEYNDVAIYFPDYWYDSTLNMKRQFGDSSFGFVEIGNLERATRVFFLFVFIFTHPFFVVGFFSIFKVDVEEVMYVAKELWRGRSARDQTTKEVGRGMWRSVNELMLVRYQYFMVSKIKPIHFQSDSRETIFFNGV